jgi:AbrB family looped-hinge helix DNA binding protein
MAHEWDMADAFVGSVTVGERGQVVIPAEARESLGIHAGDKLVVLRHPLGHGVTFVKPGMLEQAAAMLIRLAQLPHEEAPEEDGR